MSAELAALTSRVRSGQAAAFTELVQALHGELRLWLATYALDAVMVDDAALAVWCVVRRRLAACPEAPLPWVLDLARNELAQRLALPTTDALPQTQARVAAAELQAVAVPTLAAGHQVRDRLGRMPLMAQRLLHRHYAEQLPIAALAAAQNVPLEDVADSLVMARSSLDWQPDASVGASAHGPFSAIIEEYLAGVLDGDLRGRFAGQVLADRGRAATFMRQACLDLVLRALLGPLGEDAARVVAHSAWATLDPGAGAEPAPVPELRRVEASRSPSEQLRRIATPEHGARRVRPSDGLSRPRTSAPATGSSGLAAGLVAGGLILVGSIALLLTWGRGDHPRAVAAPVVVQAPSAEVPGTLDQDPALSPPKVLAAPVPTAARWMPRSDGQAVFVRGINLGGEGVVIERNPWIGQRQALAGGLVLGAEAVAATIPPLSGAGLDFDGKSMLERGIIAGGGPVRLSQALPAGTYEITLWVAGDGAAGAVSLVVGERTENAPPLPGTAWRRLGPYRTTLTGAPLVLTISGPGHAVVSGLTLATIGAPAAPIPPVALLTLPQADAIQDDSRPLDLLAEVVASSAEISTVAFMDGDQVLGSVSRPPWRLTLAPHRLHAHVAAFSAVATAVDGGHTASPRVAVSIVATPAGAGTILREKWLDVSTDYLKTAATNPKLKNAPDQSGPLTILDEPRNDGKAYYSRLRGYLVPPQTGTYVFWITADNEGELALSSDETPEKCRVLCWSSRSKYGNWDGGKQRSAPLTLQAGNRYYLEIRHQQGAGDSHCSVGWKLPDGGMERPIPGMRLSPWVEK